MWKYLLLLAFTLAPAVADDSPQGAALLKTDLLAVLAHPDDEAGIASALGYYAHVRGKTVTNIYCTRGEGGGNMVGTHWGASLGVLREAELRRCLETLGVARWFFLDQLDWAYTESAAMTLAKWDRAEALEKLVRFVRATRPEIILTMNPIPRPGQHGHHQAAGILAIEAFNAAADPAQFPDQLTKEGLTTWQTRKLFFRARREPGAKADPLITSVLPVGKNAAGIEVGDLVGDALRNHRSQGFGRFSRSGRIRRPDEFLLVKSVVAPAEGSDDLFDGLPVEGSPNTIAIGKPASEVTLAMHFSPRPAYQNFDRWSKEHGVDSLTRGLTSDIPVVAGEPNRIVLNIASAEPKEVKVGFELPKDWRMALRPETTRLKPGNNAVELSVIPPPDATQDAAIIASISGGDSAIATRTMLHPLPKLDVSRAAKQPTDADWEKVTPIAIAPHQLVQGKVENAADSSATFRLLHSDAFLFVEVDVRDQTIVSNIAPNDIRGHWRSDSVEICIDPNPGSEHTLGCFKVGIFPFDSAGNIRAARDADAHQGPIEETARGMKLTSTRTAHGYRIRTAIPWQLIGKKTDHLGFNIILYDGDKADAEPGENINQSRLAWAPQRGVQGRPEDWGRIHLLR